MFKLVVLSVVLAVATANPSGLWGAGLATPLAAPLAATWGAPWAAGVATPLAAPLANPLLAPVATLAVAGPGHLIKKRSILAAPLAASPLVASPLAASPLVAGSVAWGRSAGWVAPAPVVAAAAPVAPWGLGVGARVAPLW